ncbi:hypothetical protein JCM10212_001819 [Sporobolomyces blumeae]
MSNPLNFAPYSDPPDFQASSSSSRRTNPGGSASSAPGPTSFPSYSYHDGASVPSLSSAHGTSYTSSSPNPLGTEAGAGVGSALGRYYGYPTTVGSSTSTPSTFHPSQQATFSTTDTTLNLKLEYLAAIAYALGPFGAVFLLVFEVENDYVRFHSYQSILLSISLALLHFVSYFILWSWVQKLLVLFDIACLGIMALRAWSDCDHLDRYRIPVIGVLADSWVEAE